MIPATGFVLPDAAPEILGLDAARLARLCEAVETGIASGLCRSAEIAVARHGRLALWRSFGAADRRDPLWLLYSNTKVLVASALWCLSEDGVFSFNDPVAAHFPGFERHGKGVWL